MATPTVPVTVTLASQDGTPYEGVIVTARLDANEVYEGFVISDSAEATTDVDGVAILNLFPNAPDPIGLGTQGTTYRVTAKVPGGRSLNVRAQVPDAACRLENILIDADPVTLNAAQVALAQAQTAVTTAAASAADAQAKATAAAASEANASVSEAAASASATAAAASAAASSDSAMSAESSASGAASSRSAIDNRIYPGTYASDPTTRPDGSAIQTGDEYTTAAGERKVRNGGGWVAVDAGLRTDLSSSGGAALVSTIAAGAGAVLRDLQEKVREISLDVRDFGAVAGVTTDQSAAFHKAFDAAKAAGIGVVRAEGTYRFTSNLVLRDGVSLIAPSRASLILEMNNCYVTHEIIAGRNPACRDSHLRATIKAVNTTDQYGLVLQGVQYSTFDVKVIGFQHASGIGIFCTSAADGAAWRYVTNNVFWYPEVADCTKGVKLTRNALDPATFGANFNLFVGGYINGYSTVGTHVEYGEANAFFGTRCTTSIGAGSIGWLVEDSVNALIGCTADGSFGGTVPGTIDSWGFPHGRDGDTTTVGFRFNAGSGGCIVLNPRGDACYKRFDFDSQTTMDQITILGRVDYNWLPDLLAKAVVLVSDSVSAAPLTINNRATGTTTLAVYKNGNSVVDGTLKMLSNGAIEFGSGDSDIKLTAGNAVKVRAQGSNGAWRPEGDNTQSTGTATNRWSVVYAGTATINTSDEREKQQVQPIDAAALRAWAKVEYCQFKFRDAVQIKGDGARWHFGVIAQRVKEAFESEGLDAFAYGVLCYDEWPDQYEPGEEGEPVLVTPAGNRYGIRYEEALALECAYLRSRLPN